MKMAVNVTDCEGEISKNDNAYELSVFFVPDGDKFFPLVSKIDDVWADNIVQPGYKAGDTLRLILPFLKAYGATNERIREYSEKNILVVPGAGETLEYVSSIMPCFMISTSYRPYISALCKLIGFPEEKVYCTELDIDKYRISKREFKKLDGFRRKINKMKMIEIPDGAKAIEDFSPEDQKNIKRLYEIFWEEIPKMPCGKMLKEVNPVGGWEKANAAKKIAEITGEELRNFIYFGDSITDVPVFQLIRKANGVTVSFNGNRYAVREAEIATMSNHALPIAILAAAFNKYGRDGVFELVRGWSYNAIHRIVPELYDESVKIFPRELPKVVMITDNNRKDVADESNAFRKTVRGEAIGKLG